jgi:hypothetical protein
VGFTNGLFAQPQRVAPGAIAQALVVIGVHGLVHGGSFGRCLRGVRPL